jgi:ribosomal protein S27E
MTPNSEVALAILAAFGVIALLSLMGAYLVIGMAWERSPVRTNRPDDPRRTSSGWRLIGRALALRCPKCGLGSIFDSRFRMRVTCQVCGVVFWKSSGEWLGPGIVDYSIATGSGLVAWAGMVLLGVSAITQLVFASLVALIIAAALSRWSRSFWTLLLYISGDLTEARDAPKTGPSST